MDEKVFIRSFIQSCKGCICPSWASIYEVGYSLNEWLFPKPYLNPAAIFSPFINKVNR